MLGQKGKNENLLLSQAQSRKQNIPSEPAMDRHEHSTWVLNK